MDNNRRLIFHSSSLFLPMGTPQYDGQHATYPSLIVPLGTPFDVILTLSWWLDIIAPLIMLSGWVEYTGSFHTFSVSWALRLFSCFSGKLSLSSPPYALCWVELLDSFDAFSVNWAYKLLPLIDIMLNFVGELSLVASPMLSCELSRSTPPFILYSLSWVCPCCSYHAFLVIWAYWFLYLIL